MSVSETWLHTLSTGTIIRTLWRKRQRKQEPCCRLWGYNIPQPGRHVSENLPAAAAPVSIRYAMGSCARAKRHVSNVMRPLWSSEQVAQRVWVADDSPSMHIRIIATMVGQVPISNSAEQVI